LFWSVYLFCLFIRLFVCCLFICLLIYLFVCLFVCLFFCLLICVFFFSICLFFFLFVSFHWCLFFVFSIAVSLFVCVFVIFFCSITSVCLLSFLFSGKRRRRKKGDVKSDWWMKMKVMRFALHNNTNNIDLLLNATILCVMGIFFVCDVYFLYKILCDFSVQNVQIFV
jgi:hypothetical protein